MFVNTLNRLINRFSGNACKFRAAQIEDIPFIESLYSEGVKEGHYHGPGTMAHDMFIRYLLEGRTIKTPSRPQGFASRTFVMENRKHLTGFVTLSGSPYSEEAIEIWMFSVHPAFRRQGIATRTIREICEANSERTIHARTFPVSNAMTRLLQTAGFKVFLSDEGRTALEWRLP